MTQNTPDDPSSPQPIYMGPSSDTFNYMQEQSKLKATVWDGGLVKGASIRRQAYQDPISAHSGATDFTHVVPDGASTSEMSSLNVHVASSQNASPFPTPQAPAQLQDLFYGSMNQQAAWIDPSSSEAFGMMGAESFLPGGSQHHLIAQDMDRLAPPSSFNFPVEPHPTGQPPEFAQDFSSKVSPFILRPIPSSPRDHAPPLPATNIIPPMPCKDVGSQTNITTSTNTIRVSLSDSSSLMDLGDYPSATASHERFPEEHEPVTHQEGHLVTGRRSAELNAALDVGFAAVERCFLDLSGSTTFPISQLINKFLKSCGRNVNGTNYWNLYSSYFKEHMKMELSRIGREVQAGGGTPSPSVRTWCYDKFKEAYPDSYQDLLSMHEEASTQPPSNLALKQPLSSVVKWSTKMDHLATHIFWETRCRASDDAIIGHLKAHVYNGSSLAVVDEAFNDGTCLKWVKLELIKQVAQLGGKCAWDKNFPWKSMPSALTDANLSIRGYPAHKCLLPGEAHNENSRNKGIGALTQKEIAVLVDALKEGTMHVVKVDKTHRAAVIASERPVITGIAPPSDWPHAGARRLFAKGSTDHHGPARLKPSNAATKVKQADKAPRASPPPSADNDNSDNDCPVVPAAPKTRKPT
ncbi:hypothetical protein DFH29DRAFT_878605, partial [Suillus ampliporus]